VEGAVGVVLRHISSDGHGGYPGRLDVEGTYRLTDDNELALEYRATTTKATPINLTQHSYFNLKGEGNGTVLDHELTIDADAFTPVAPTLIPTGEFRSVAGTPFDFREPVSVGARIDADTRQLRIAKGYDQNFVLARQGRDALHLAARVYEPESGRELEVLTTEPDLQFYSSNFLDGSLIGKVGPHTRSTPVLPSKHSTSRTRRTSRTSRPRFCDPEKPAPSGRSNDSRCRKNLGRPLPLIRNCLPIGMTTRRHGPRQLGSKALPGR